MAKNSERGLYGAGGNKANPFFPDETNYQGPGKSIQSPHGTAFAGAGGSGPNAFDSLPSLGGFTGGKGRKGKK